MIREFLRKGAAYYAALIAVGIMAAVLGPTLPALSEQTHTSLRAISLILALRPAGYLTGAVLSGRLLDRFPGHPLMAVAIALSVLSLAFIPLAPSLLFLAIPVFCMGLADGSLDVSSNTLLTWVYGDKVGPYMNGLHFAFGLGALATPLGLAQIFHVGGSIQVAYLAAALIILPLVLVFFKLPSPVHQVEKDRASQPVKVPIKVLALVFGIFLAYGGSEAAFGNWIFSYARATGLEGEARAAYLTSLFWGCLTLGRLAGIAVAMRVSINTVLAADGLLTALSLGLILVLPHSNTALWWGTAGTGLGMASFFPTLMALAGERLAQNGRLSGKLTSLLFMASSAGTILLPWLIGQGFESVGPRLAVGAIFGVIAGMDVLLWLLFVPKLQKTIP